jgi:RNA polymerase primary sigma factor
MVNSQAAKKNNTGFYGENNGQEKVVQADNVVQLSGSEFAQQSLVARSVNRLLYSLHLLPVFLMDSAVQADGVLSADSEDSADFKKRLSKAKRELKTLRQQMISANTGLVAFVAHKYKTSNLSFEDLMQEGLVGLIKAVDRFDPDRGICFSTYAIYWIRQAISRLIVKQEKIVRLPVALAEKAATVFEAMRSCYLRYERWPSIAELKLACDLSEQEIKTISSYYQATHSLDAAIGDDDDNLELMAKMQQHQFSLPLDELIDQDLAQYVDKAVASLPEKQAAILTMRFGLRDHTEMTLQAVADQLHVTRERVRQIQNEALKKLKQQFGFDLMLFLEPKDG